MTTTYTDVEALELVPRKRTASDRLGRCHRHGGFLWRGAQRRPACPVCGGGLATTTSSLRSGFRVLTDEVLDVVERYPGGLPATIDWHRGRSGAGYYFGRAGDELLRADEVTIVQQSSPGYGELEGDRIARHRGSIINIDGLLRRAHDELRKAAKAERRLARLGGELEEPRR